MVITWIDAPERVDRLLPGLLALAGSGMVTVEDVGIASYAIRPLERLRFDLKAGDVMMRTPYAAREDTTVRDVVAALIGQRFRGAPVVDRTGVVVGVVTNQDLVDRAGLSVRIELLGAVSSSRRAQLLSSLRDGPVCEVMTKNPVTIGVTETLRAAAMRMGDRGLKRLPVVDDAGRLAGVLSRTDVLAAVAESFPRERAASPDPHGAETIGELARTNVPRVAPTADLATLLDVIVSTRLNRAIVVDDDGRVLGVVNDADVVSALGNSGKVLERLMRRAGLRASSSSVTASQLMHEAGVMGADTPLAEAVREMIENRRKVLVVVNAQHVLVGIVDRADLLRACSGSL